jgi:transcriptional regulator with XRE-family HTH domain
MLKLKDIRADRNMTQIELSKLSGVSQPYINELENLKKRNPSVSILKKLSSTLGVRISEIMGEDVGA